MTPPSLLPGSGAPASRDVVGLLESLGRDPRPRLTWYGPDGARVELTGRVLVTWVAKTAHLLQEEVDLGPGGTLATDLPADWRGAVFWLAARHLGAEVRAGGAPGTEPPPGVDPPEAQVVAEDDERARTPTGARTVLVVVARSPLPGPAASLPAGAVDYGADVASYPDTLPAPGGRAALPAPDGTAANGGRVLLGPGCAAEDLVRVWAGGGSVVLHTGLAPAVLDRVRAQENVTVG